MQKKFLIFKITFLLLFFPFWAFSNILNLSDDTTPLLSQSQTSEVNSSAHPRVPSTPPPPSTPPSSVPSEETSENNTINIQSADSENIVMDQQSDT